MTISEMIEVLQHSEKGGSVERLIKSSHKPKWDYVEAPTWDFNGCNYRIKPEPKRVPLNQQDLIERIKGGKTMWVKYEQFDNKYWQITGFDSYSVYFAFDEIDYDLLKEFGTFIDGTPCSKEADHE